MVGLQAISVFLFFSYSEAERMEVGATLTIGPCMPIILAGEQK